MAHSIANFFSLAIRPDLDASPSLVVLNRADLLLIPGQILGHHLLLVDMTAVIFLGGMNHIFPAKAIRNKGREVPLSKHQIAHLCAVAGVENLIHSVLEVRVPRSSKGTLVEILCALVESLVRRATISAELERRSVVTAHAILQAAMASDCILNSFATKVDTAYCLPYFVMHPFVDALGPYPRSAPPSRQCWVFSTQFSPSPEIYSVLKQLHPDLGINTAAVSVVERSCKLRKDAKTVLFEIVSSAIRMELQAPYADPVEYGFAQKFVRTGSQIIRLTTRTIQNSMRWCIPGELGKHALSEGVKAVTKFNCSGVPGLQLAVSEVEQAIFDIACEGRYVDTLQAGVMAAVLQRIFSPPLAFPRVPPSRLIR
jgi:hypothetical protein